MKLQCGESYEYRCSRYLVAPFSCIVMPGDAGVCNYFPTKLLGPPTTSCFPRLAACFSWTL